MMIAIINFLLANIATLLTLLVGGVFYVRTTKDDMKMKEGLRWILAILCLLVLSELSQRWVTLNGISSRVASLSSQVEALVEIPTRVEALVEIGKRGEEQLQGLNAAVSRLENTGTSIEFLSERGAVWERAKSIISGARDKAYIYDTTSVENKVSYEQILEQKRAGGADVYRIVCAPSDAGLDEFIKIPQSLSQSEAGKYSISHVPHPLPFDCLIVESGPSIDAIIGFRTTIGIKTITGIEYSYCAALHTRSGAIANEILDMVRNMYTSLSEEHMAKAKKGGCSLCEEMNRRITPLK